MATSFPSSTATMANTPDVVPRLPEPTPSEETTQTEPTELPTSPTKQADKSPTEPRTSPTKHADESLTKESQDMSSEKQQWISEEQHNGPPMQDIKHDPRAGSGIEFVSPQEELEEKQVNPSSPENEESSPKYGVPKPESEGLETVPGQNEGQENRPVYINNDEEQGSNSGRNAEETDWHFSFWDCWKSGSLGIESLCCPCVLAGRTHQHLHYPPASNSPYTHIPSTNWYCTSCCLLSIFVIAGAPLYYCMTSTQRREVRYKYHIKGNNGVDCLAATFCVCCALVQEEKEVVWRMQKELEKKGGGQMERRVEEMKYQPDVR